jgi:hypothetical protein
MGLAKTKEQFLHSLNAAVWPYALSEMRTEVESILSFIVEARNGRESAEPQIQHLAGA